MEQPQRIRSLLIPLQEGHALLPNSTVAEVLPFTAPTNKEDAPSWVLGDVFWRAHEIPLVSLESLVFAMLPEPGARARIIVTKVLDGASKPAYFGLLAAGAPRLMNLERTMISLDEAAETAIPGALSRVWVDGLAAVIPDLDLIAAELA